MSKTVPGKGSCFVRGAVYNLAIPNIIPNRMSRSLGLAPGFRTLARISFVILGLGIAANAVDWSNPEQRLARKIVAVTGPGTMAITVENRSSLGNRDSEVIQNGLRSALEGVGIRFAKSEAPAGTVRISLSENPTFYIWVAEIRQGTGDPVVVMVSAPRPEGSTAARESVPLSLRKILLWTQDNPILDVAVLEENGSPTLIAVLDPEKLSLYRLQSGKWQQGEMLIINHTRPWPRDLRGRVIPARDHLLDVYLPDLTCHSGAGAPLTLNCRESDDPWPLVPAALSGGTVSVFPSASSTSVAIPQVGAFYASTRNFFTGALTPGVGKFATVSKFYSAAWLPRERYLLWVFAAKDGRVHVVDGVDDQATRLDWGSDLTSVKTSCGAGWQVLSTGAEENGDSVRAYEFPDRDPIAVSATIDFPGSITALWTEAKGDTAIAVARNRETGSYEAFRLAIACSQ